MNKFKNDVADKAENAENAMSKISKGLLQSQVSDAAGNITYKYSTRLDADTKAASEARANITNEIAKQFPNLKK